ncbi:protein kinase [Dactylosporangium aurantiacum]|uniref:Protein kinase n=1 Tax=Dactylosporangium aurantiacum TaxID=35754 RepID=A0A9Q9ICT2_9ACTN|nr:serine/threonine-protein kinase [Dactylosporangium aurantiacum]MDG6105143.1 serine/threonine-protein kinase [Dactylosporangium aurantiacum]UWZ51667.1 protein kinase [Dactylosporangium aurantiacum]
MGDAPAPLRAGDPTAVGSYRLLGVLGVGGMGTVYLAAGPDERRVALKVINPVWHGDPQFRQRFAAEAAAASRVAGFCTARVLDVALDGPVPHLVTEYVPGPSLHDYATVNGPLGGQVEAVAVGVAAALTAIHAVGLVHADLSPRNVLLSPFGPKVIDFGVARPSRHSGPVGQLFGTPGWLAPEQERGAPPSQASDVYAWGVLVAWAGTGVMPAGAVPAGLAPGLAEIVGRALRHDPAARPSARQILLALVGDDDPAAVHVTSPRADPGRHGGPGGPAGATATVRGAAPPRPAGRRPGRFAPGAAPVVPVSPTAVHGAHPAGVPVSPVPVSPTMLDPAAGTGFAAGHGGAGGPRLPLPPVPPPPRGRPRRVGQAVSAVVAVLIVLGCLWGVFNLAGSAGSGDPQAGPSSAAPASKAPSRRPSPVATDGGVRFTVVGFECGAAQVGQWPVVKQAQGQFCLVELKVENLGTGGTRIWQGSQRLRDTEGNEHKPDEWSWLYNEATRPLYGEIKAGKPVVGTLVFDVPKGLSFDVLVVKQQPLSSGTVIRLPGR